MNPLESSDYINPATVSPRPTGMRYGLIWGLVGIVLGLIAYLMGWSDPSNPNTVMGILIWLVSLGISITILVMAIKQHRDQELGGYITLGRAFTTGMIATLVSAIIATIWMVILANVIDPDMFSASSMEAMMVEQWEEQGLTDDQIEQAKGYAGMFTGPVAMTVMTFLGSLFWGAILSIIIAAVMKKEAPRVA